MDQNAWIMLLVGIAISCCLFALGVVLYPKLKTEKQGYPFEAEIEAALLPLIFQGICRRPGLTLGLDGLAFSSSSTSAHTAAPPPDAWVESCMMIFCAAVSQ